MEFRVLTSLSEIKCVLPAWLKLWEGQSRCLPSTHPFWLFTWYEQFLLDVDPLLCVWSNEDVIYTIAPMMRLRKDHGAFKKGSILFAAYHTADYAEILASDENSLAHSFSTILQTFGEGPLIFQNVRSDSATASLVKGLGKKMRIISEVKAPYLSMEATNGQRFDSFISNKRHAEVRRRKKLAENTGVEFFYNACLTEDEFYWFCGQSAYLQKQGLEARGIISSYSDPRRVAFYTCLLKRMSSSHLVRISYAKLGPRLLAFAVGFAINGTLYQWATAYDKECSRLALGSSLLYEIIQRGYAAGVTEVDLMKGEEEYKQIWTTGYRKVTTYQFLT